MVSARTALLISISLGLALGCSNSTAREDSRVYDVILEHMRKEGLEVSGVHLGGSRDVFLEECLDSSDRPCERLQTLQAKLPGLERETFERFLALQPKEEPQPSRTSPSIALSSISYNDNRSQALVHATYMSTENTAGHYYLLTKRNGEWTVSGTTAAWVS